MRDSPSTSVQTLWSSRKPQSMLHTVCIGTNSATLFDRWGNRQLTMAFQFEKPAGAEMVPTAATHNAALQLLILILER